MAAKDVLGRQGEAIAREHLRARGMVILECNWRCSLGEIDIVARDGDQLVVVEVKTRSGMGYGHPLASITPDKLARLRRLAAAWCADRVGPHPSLRIDAVAVVVPRRGNVTVEHLTGIS